MVKRGGGRHGALACVVSESVLASVTDTSPTLAKASSLLSTSPADASKLISPVVRPVTCRQRICST